MKKIFTIAVLILALLLSASIASAELNNVTAKGVDGDLVFYDKDGNEIFSIEAANRKVTYPSGSAVDVESGATLSIPGTLAVTGTFTNSRERGFTLPLTGFVFENTGAPLSTSTTPGLEVDDAIPNIVWADGETSAVMITFRVPYDYSSGGAFRVFATESDSTTPNQIDFDVYVNRAGSAIDSAATGQTPVALNQATSTPSVVTLTPATDFASLAAGDWVTLRIWRDDVAAGTGDLEVKGVEFFYTASR